MIINHTFAHGQSQGIAPDRKVFYLTCHLKRAIHASIRRSLNFEFERKVRNTALISNLELRVSKQFQLKKLYLHKLESLLHSRHAGPHYLHRKRLAEIVEQRILDLDGLHYNLLAFSIMPNHFHLLIESEIIACPNLDETCIAGKQSEVSKVLNLITDGTMKPINAALKRVGPVWSSAYYGMQVEDSQTQENITRYILENPHKGYEPGLPVDYEFNFVKNSCEDASVKRSVS